MSGLELTELLTGFLLVFVACVVISRPAYRSSRFLLGMAVAAFAVGLFGVFDGLA